MAKKTPVESSTPIYVGVDDGFACTDVVVMDGSKVVKTLVIPSRARPGVHGTTAIGEEGGIIPVYETEGAQFTVAELADAESARFDDYPFSPMNRCIVHHALRMADLGGRDIVVGTGLPLAIYYKGDKKNQEVLARKHASIMTAVRAMDGSAMANIVNHEVFPEGLAAWVDYAVGDNGEVRVDMEETVGVIDIGGRTTDCAVVLPGKRIDHARCGSADVGVLNVVETVRVAVLKEMGHDVGGAIIERSLRSKSLKLWGKQHDISGLVDAAVKAVTDTVLREINRRLGQAFDIDRILLVGGGASVFKDVVCNRYPNVVIPDQPELANGRGFGKYLSL